MKVLVNVRCGLVRKSGRPCRRLMATVGREQATPPSHLVVEFRGREPVFAWPKDGGDPRLARPPSQGSELIRDPRHHVDLEWPSGGVTALTCEQHPTASPFLSLGAPLRDKLLEAGQSGRPVDLLIPDTGS